MNILFSIIFCITTTCVFNNSNANRTNFPHVSKNQLPFTRVIIWGHKLHSHTHSYIHWGFYRAFQALGYQTYWFDNKDINSIDPEALAPALFITEGQVDQRIPVRDDCFYILHNCNTKKYHQALMTGHAIELQVYTNDCKQHGGEYIAPYTYESIAKKTIWQPWATDLLPDEIEQIKNNFQPNFATLDTVYFIGTIWGGEHGNTDAVDHLHQVLQENNILFKHITGCSLEENIYYVQQSRIAPALQGQWQVEHGYIPCRIFKNISYGHIGMTNSETVWHLFHEDIIFNADSIELTKQALKVISEYPDEKRLAVMTEVQEQHTYVNRIATALDFLTRIYNSITHYIPKS